MPKNASITAFFKPVPKSSQASSQALPSSPRVREALSPQQQAPPSSPSPPLFLPSSPPEPRSSARDRNAVIQDSDDEDDDHVSSDDDLPDIFSKPVVRTVIPAPPARNTAASATPRRKRTALGLESSPLTIMPRHRFDIKALMKHAEADQAVEASAQRMESILASKSAPLGTTFAATATPGHGPRHPISLHETMVNAFSEPEDSQEEGARNKLLRAVQRTEATVHRPLWYFFDYEVPRQKDTGSPSIEARLPFPGRAATGVWAFLAQARHRSEYFEDGVPYNVQESMQNLPDEIFLWVLQEVPNETSRKLRDEYLRLLSVCPDQTSRLVDEELVDKLFRDVGASERVFKSPSQAASGGGFANGESPYLQRNWTPLRSVIRIITEISQGLALPALIRSVTILLRLGMDNLIREDQAIATDYQEALSWLVYAVPDTSWDNFCGDVCVSLHSHVEESALRCAAAASIPLLSPRLVQLRRRLALVCIFDDTQHARAPPDASLSMRAVIDRLESDEFIVDRHHTDFFELAALAELLGFAIGDGNPPTVSGGGPQAVKQFNAEVDELARKVKVMYSGIHGQGAAFASRLDAKVTLQDLERKLQHATRTRPPPRASIFGIEVNEDEAERPKQQKFMQRFLQNKIKQPELP